MGEQENKIISFLLQSSTVLGIIAFIGIVFSIAVPEAKIEAILVVTGIFAAFHQYTKDYKDAVSLVSWVLQPTTLRALVFSGSILVGFIMPEGSLDKIVKGSGLLLLLIEIFRDEITKMLVFSKTE